MGLDFENLPNTMGQVAIYKCDKCEQRFETSGGGGFRFVELRCEQCDRVYRTPRSEWPSGLNLASMLEDAASAQFASRDDVEEARSRFVCADCHVQLRDDLLPKCPSCGSRSVEIETTLMNYD